MSIKINANRELFMPVLGYFSNLKNYLEIVEETLWTRDLKNQINNINDIPLIVDGEKLRASVIGFGRKYIIVTWPMDSTHQVWSQFELDTRTQHHVPALLATKRSKKIVMKEVDSRPPDDLVNWANCLTLLPS